MVGEGGNLGMTQRGRIEAAQQRRAAQHRLHRQLRRRGHLRPRGQHQDPAQRRGAARRADHGAAQHAAGQHDRRGRRAGAQRQLPPEPGDQPDGSDERGAPGLFSSISSAPWNRRACSIARSNSCRAMPSSAERKARGQGLTRPELSVLLSLRQDRRSSTSCWTPTCRKTRTCPRNWCAISRSRCRKATRTDMENHRLRREIIATAVTNSTGQPHGRDLPAAHAGRHRRDARRRSPRPTPSPAKCWMRASCGRSIDALDLQGRRSRCRSMRCRRSGTCSAT